MPEVVEGVVPVVVVHTELWGGKGQLTAPAPIGSQASGVPRFTITGQCGPGALQCPTTLQPGGRDESILHSHPGLLSHTGMESWEWGREHSTRDSRFLGLLDN